MSSHRYWRVRFNASNGGVGEPVWLDQLAFLDQGDVDLSVGGTALSGGDYNAGTPPSLAFDKRVFGDIPDIEAPFPGTGWLGATTWPEWIGYDHTTTKDVRQVMLRMNRTSHGWNDLPVRGQVFVEWSDDGVSWTVEPIREEPFFGYAHGSTVTLRLSDWVSDGDLVLPQDWFTICSGLTPIWAIDSRTYTTTGSLKDRIGSNDLKRAPRLQESPRFRMSGDGTFLEFTSNITLPTNCVIVLMCGYEANTWQAVWLALKDTNHYVMHQAGTGPFSCNGAGGGGEFGGTPPQLASTPAPVFMVVTLDAAGGELWANGAKFPVKRPRNNFPDVVNGFGYTPYTAHHVEGSDYLYACAIFEGAPPSEFDMRNMRATLLDFTTGIPTTTRALLPLLSSKGGDTLADAGKVSPFLTLPMLTPVLSKYDHRYSGNGRISGTVKRKSSPNNTPVARRVLLVDEKTCSIVLETWSNATSGAYTFNGVSPLLKFSVIAYDYTLTHPAVIASNITPTVVG